MRHEFLRRFSDLADPTLLLLGGLALFFYLWSGEERRLLARSWGLAFGMCVFLTIASKLVFYLVGGGETGPFRLHSPSGHVAIGTGFFGCCALMLAARRQLAVQVLICAGTALLLGMFAASRIMLGLHTVPEIAVAFVIGLFTLAVFGASLGNREPTMVNAGQVASLLLLIAVTHYTHVDGEALIERLAQKIGDSGRATGVADGMSIGTIPFDRRLLR
jgi:hypothetical protein